MHAAVAHRKALINRGRRLNQIGTVGGVSWAVRREVAGEQRVRRAERPA
jgi:hypothetical protein